MSVDAVCQIKTCERPRNARGWCSGHYRRWRLHGDPLHGGPLRPYGAYKVCQEPSCNEKPHARGWCNGHYQTYHRRLGITHEDRQRLIDEADGACAICGNTESRLVTDHDHASGQLRELLCDLCNRGLGLMRDDPEVLRAAADYIERHRE